MTTTPRCIRTDTRAQRGICPFSTPSRCPLLRPQRRARACTRTTGGKLPSPDNLVLEFPDQYQAAVACYGRGLDPRGPYAQPPEAPFLLPGNLAAMTFGPAELPRGGLYVATSPTGVQRHRAWHAES